MVRLFYHVISLPFIRLMIWSIKFQFGKIIHCSSLTLSHLRFLLVSKINFLHDRLCFSFIRVKMGYASAITIFSPDGHLFQVRDPRTPNTLRPEYLKNLEGSRPRISVLSRICSRISWTWFHCSWYQGCWLYCLGYREKITIKFIDDG